MKVIFDHTEDVAKNIKTFWFKPTATVRYVAGQFTQISLPLDRPDERGDKHWFTLSSSPTEELLGVTTKFAPGYSSAFKTALAQLQKGAELTLADPMGDFVLPKDKTVPLLFIAGGIGSTTYRSMIKWLADKQEKRTIHLVYSVRNADELAFLDLFSAYDMEFTPVVTEPDGNWQGQTGMLDTNRVLEFANTMDGDPLIYISGPEPMVEKFVAELGATVPPHRLVADYFPGYKDV